MSSKKSQNEPLAKIAANAKGAIKPEMFPEGVGEDVKNASSPKSISRRSEKKADREAEEKSTSEAIVNAMRPRYGYNGHCYYKLGNSFDSKNHEPGYDPYENLNQLGHTVESAKLWLKKQNIDIAGDVDLWVEEVDGKSIVRNLFIEDPDDIIKPEAGSHTWKSVYYMEGFNTIVFQIPPPHNPAQPPVIKDAEWCDYILRSKRQFLARSHKVNWKKLLAELPITDGIFTPQLKYLVNHNLKTINKDSEAVILEYFYYLLKNFGLFDDDYKSGMDYREGEYNYRKPTDESTFMDHPEKIDSDDPRSYWTDLLEDNKEMLAHREDMQNLIALAFNAGAESVRQRLSERYAPGIKIARQFKENAPKKGQPNTDHTKVFDEVIKAYKKQNGYDGSILTESKVRKFILESDDNRWKESLAMTMKGKTFSESLKGYIRRIKKPKK